MDFSEKLSLIVQSMLADMPYWSSCCTGGTTTGLKGRCPVGAVESTKVA